MAAIVDMHPSQPLPTDLAAVFDVYKKQWWLYYITSDGNITILEGPKEGELENSLENHPYKKITLSLSSAGVPKPKAGNTQLGVAEYLDTHGQPQTRVYYIDDDNYLVELAWSRDKGWFRGALTTAEFKAVGHSVISTAVTKDQLKVYYRSLDKGGKARLWVAYVSLNGTGWLHRPIMEF